ncbi:hypothetical protein C8R44DRAFT_744551 [Mycena epipterygia]|nr:hypothetical protein C8R44DRAFT_744551 [Mycena epipterygia]
MSPLKPGVVNLPGTTPSSTALVAELLHKDFVAHHCFWNDHHFSNHLSHHILTLHDLGAPAECIEAMYNKEAAMQRPLHPGKIETKSNRITESNWTGSLGGANIVGSSHMYPDYLAFFSSEIAKHGVPGTLERYVFSPKANGNGSLMLYIWDRSTAQKKPVATQDQIKGKGSRIDGVAEGKAETTEYDGIDSRQSRSQHPVNGQERAFKNVVENGTLHKVADAGMDLCVDGAGPESLDANRRRGCKRGQCKRHQMLIKPQFGHPDLENRPVPLP